MAVRANTDSLKGSATVMSVEDDVRIQRLIRVVLELEGYRVLQASDGLEALQLLEVDEPSVILLDLMLPGVDGWEFLRRVRQVNPRVPIILISAVRDLPKEAERVGATDHLEKPFDVAELVAKVESYVGDGPASSRSA
ncbi:MAG: response regulator [Dehalococcoidia bacterium]|nr:response regulator [Dehalococcoidia bacterium]